MNYIIEQFYESFDIYHGKQKILHIENLDKECFEFYQADKLVVRLYSTFLSTGIAIDYQDLPFEIENSPKNIEDCFIVGEDFFRVKRKWFRTKLFKNDISVGKVIYPSFQLAAEPCKIKVEIDVNDEKSNIVLLILAILNLRVLDKFD